MKLIHKIFSVFLNILLIILQIPYIVIITIIYILFNNLFNGYDISGYLWVLGPSFIWVFISNAYIILIVLSLLSISISIVKVINCIKYFRQDLSIFLTIKTIFLLILIYIPIIIFNILMIILLIKLKLIFYSYY